MTIGIVYYSRTGNTRAAAQLLADKLKQQNLSVDLIEIEAVKRPGFFSAGRAAMKQVELPIKNTDVDLGNYSTLVVGSPTWGGCCSPFIKTFFSSAKNIKGKKTALFITGGGMPDPQGKPRQMMQQDLTNFSVNLSDSFLGLQMKKGKIIKGAQQVDQFVQSIL
ncbi:MAG: flavodoxin family protein [Euryarchaeota archaeon]|nr:flavodoxin family protein [Euryarchaeota archaeon]